MLKYFVSKQNRVTYEQSIADLEKTLNIAGEPEWFLRSNPINRAKGGDAQSVRTGSTRATNNPITDGASINSGEQRVGYPSQSKLKLVFSKNRENERNLKE